MTTANIREVAAREDDDAARAKPKKYYPEFEPNTQNILRGGFQQVERNSPVGWRVFPPAGNDKYHLTSQCYDPKLHNLSARDNGPRYESRSPTAEERAENVNRMLKEMWAATPKITKGEKMAQHINFARPSWVMFTPGVSGVLYPEEDQREDFITNINENKDGGGELEFCSKCKQYHIPPGSPITLGDRDTCFSGLPDWFPKDTPRNPWDMYTDMLNEYVVLEEVERGFTHRKDPGKPQWDLHYHDKSPGWCTPTRQAKGGWWKCRSGPDAPFAEQSCVHCHAPKKPELDAKGRPKIPIAQHKIMMLDYIETRFRAQGEKDKQVVLSMFHKNGIPQYLGPPLNETVREDMVHKRDMMRSTSKRNITRSLSALSLTTSPLTMAYMIDPEADADSESSSIPHTSPVTALLPRFEIGPRSP